MVLSPNPQPRDSQEKMPDTSQNTWPGLARQTGTRDRWRREKTWCPGASWGLGAEREVGSVRGEGCGVQVTALHPRQLWSRREHTASVACRSR